MCIGPWAETNHKYLVKITATAAEGQARGNIVEMFAVELKELEQQHAQVETRRACLVFDARVQLGERGMFGPH